MDSTANVNAKLTSGNHLPYWVGSTTPIMFSKLTENKYTDVVIVGGGIAGVTIAYCLSKAGKKVILIEDGFIGSGETGRTTAHLASALDDRYYELANQFGKENTKLIAESHTLAIDFIEQTIASENIDCDFTRLDGYLFLHPTDKAQHLEDELNATQAAGLKTSFTNIVLGDGTHKSIVFPNQAQFHPLKYIAALCDAIKKSGCEIYTSTRAKKIDDKGITTSDDFTVEAQHIVVATNSPVNNRFVMHLKQYPYRTYVIGAKIKKGVLPKALWWDTGNFEMNSEMAPYHYVRTQYLDTEYDLLIVGGEDHATGLADAEKLPEEKRYSILEIWTKKHFPQIEEVIYKWSGQVMKPMDCLAYIGRNPLDKDNVFIVTGDSGNGMTHGTIAGILITDLITGKKNPWEKLYSPSRFNIFKSGKTFIKELVGTMIAHIKTKPHHLETTGLKDIHPDEGKIIEFNGEKFGAYRDSNDNIHFVAAECTHLGCLIKWNNDEKSWDCPCHGSRFNHEGKVLNGPAIKNLDYHTQNKTTINNL